MAMGISLKGAEERSVGGVHGMLTWYISTVGSWCRAALSSMANIARLDDIEGFLLMEPSMLVGVFHPVSSLYMPAAAGCDEKTMSFSSGIGDRSVSSPCAAPA